MFDRKAFYDDRARFRPAEQKRFYHLLLRRYYSFFIPAGSRVLEIGCGTGDLLASLTISGSVSPRSRVAVIPKMSGTLQRVTVDIGDRVSSGQLVAIQDRRELDAQTDAAEAAVAVARAGLEQSEAGLANAKLEFDRSTNLFQKGALAKQRLDAAIAGLRAGIRTTFVATCTPAPASAGAAAGSSGAVNHAT